MYEKKNICNSNYINIYNWYIPIKTIATSSVNSDDYIKTGKEKLTIENRKIV